MSFLDHLEELRMTIIRSLVAIVVVGIVVYVLSGPIFEDIIFGHLNPDFFMYNFFCDYGICMKPPVVEIIAVKFGEEFFTNLKVSFYLGFVLSFPYVFYQFWKFIKPGLYEKEQKAARGIVFVCSFLFISGVIFGYLILALFGVNFLGNYSVTSMVLKRPSLSSYVGYMTMFTLPTGILFQMPVLVYFLSKIGLITASFMRKYRKHAFIIILIISAIVTPPDVITQFLISVPIYILYELSIFIAQRMEKKYQKSIEG